jgi:hypothetical protein
MTVPESPFYDGRFGRMFRELPNYEPSQTLIDTLAKAMVEQQAPDEPPPAPPPPAPGGWPPAPPPTPAPGDGDETSPFDNPDLPAGYTYLGQFLDHDITFDPTSSLQHRNDPDALRNFRTPRLDLDSLYGRGPDDEPYLYDQDGRHLLIGENPDTDLAGQPIEKRDLPRNRLGRALIGDKRNDENIIVGQLQLLFLDFHNQVVDDIEGGRLDEHLLPTRDVFREARRMVRWHYQWIVITDFLPRVCGADVVSGLLDVQSHSRRGGGELTVRRFHPDPHFYKPKRQPFMPVEFSVAAYRFGHSMVRDEYDLNDVVQNIPIFVPAPDPQQPLTHLGGFRFLPRAWTIDWPRFFSIDGSSPQRARLIDTLLSPPLASLPPNIAPDNTSGKSLAHFNLLRGKRLGLPTGQAVARAMGLEPLGSELSIGEHSAADLGVDREAPLWFYVLKEAELLQGGRRLGDVGARIVAEVILGLIAADPSSFLRIDPTWTPHLPTSAAGTFTMSDLAAYALQQRPAS